MTHNNFAQWRETLGLTQAQAAEELGVDVRTIKLWEATSEREPSLAVRKVMRAYSLGIRVDPWPLSTDRASQTLDHGSVQHPTVPMWSKAMGITAFFQMMNAPLRAPMWSWGARILSQNEQYLLRAWNDEVKVDGNERFIGLYHPDVYEAHNYHSNGIKERHRHLQAIRRGAGGWCVLCEAVDIRAIRRRIANWQPIVYPIDRIENGPNGRLIGVLKAPVSREEYLSAVR